MCRRLKVECSRAPRGSGREYINDEVKSGDLIWVPQGEQETVFADKLPAPTNLVCSSTVQARTALILQRIRVTDRISFSQIFVRVRR